MNVSGAAFARGLRVATRTLENWEQGRAQPSERNRGQTLSYPLESNISKLAAVLARDGCQVRFVYAAN